MARIPVQSNPVAGRPAAPHAPVHRAIAELPPENGYLSREVMALVPVVVDGSEEVVVVQGGHARRGHVRDIVALAKDGVNKALEERFTGVQGGGGGRHTFERTVARSTEVTPTSGDYILVVRGDKTFKVDIGDISGGGGGDMSASEILDALKTVDGSGSGLDADLLDGQSGAYYLAWGNLTSVPSSFPPSSHTHPQSEVTNLVSDLAAKAPLASPALTGAPTAPTASLATNTTQIATTAFVAAAIANLIASAPGALDTLNELAAALGNDANFSATVTAALAGKQPLDSDLTAIAALSTTSFGRSLLEAANASALRTLAGLVIGTDVQAYNAKLAALVSGSPISGDLLWDGAASTAYTPTQSGTATGTTSGAFKQFGKMLWINLSLVATSTGTTILSLPSGKTLASLGNQFLVGWNNGTGNQIFGYGASAGTTITLKTPAFADPAANGTGLSVTGTLYLA